MAKQKSQWRHELDLTLDPDYFKSLKAFVAKERETKIVLPERDVQYRAFKETPYSKVKVVILGQDPYPTEGNATGLAFEVAPGKAVPQSLKNIYKEMDDDFGSHHDLGTFHTSQGVLLLNAALTVVRGSPGSHSTRWRPFTEAVIAALNRKEKLVWMLWGARAQYFRPLLTNKKHCVLVAAHPSPLARGAFFGCQHFTRCNEYLERNHMGPIEW